MTKKIILAVCVIVLQITLCYAGGDDPKVTPTPTPLPITVTLPYDDLMETGGYYYLEAQASGGYGNYTYDWSLDSGTGEFEEDPNLPKCLFKAPSNPSPLPYTVTIRVTVSDSQSPPYSNYDTINLTLRDFVDPTFGPIELLSNVTINGQNYEYDLENMERYKYYTSAEYDYEKDIPYVAWSELNSVNGEYCMASHKNGNLWKTEQLNSDPNENYRVHNLLYDPSNDKMNLFVSYYEANEKIWAWPHNGSSWETKKAFCNQYSFYNWGEATLNPLNNYFYDAYFHNTTDRKIYLCKSNLSSADPSPTLVRDITYFYIHPVKTLADSLGYVWVAWEESWGSLRVSRFNPDKTVAGIDQYVLEYSAASPTDIVEDAAGNIWVIYTLGENIKAKYYNGSTWNTVNIVSSGRLNGNAKAWTDSDEYLYVVYQGYDETVRPTLRMTKGKAGESFTAPVQVNSNRNSNYPSISHQFGDTFFKNGVVAWAENYPRKDDPGYGSLVLARKHKAEILINNGDQSTENRTISLSISVADPTNATVYLDGDFEAWEDGSLVKLPLLVDLQTNQPTIVSGTGGIYDNIILTGCCGEKKITAVFEDNNGNISLEYVATIDYTGKPLSQITKAQWNSPEKKIDLYWNLEIPCDSSDIESINLYIDRDNNGSYESNIPLSGTWGVYTFDLASENADIFAFNIAAKHTTTSCGGSQENIYEKDPVVVKTNDILLIPWPQCVDFQIAPNLPHSPGQSHYIYFQYSEPIEDSDDYESFNQLKGDLDLLYPYMEDHYQAANASSGGQSNIILINPELSYLEGEIPIEPFYTAKSLMPANEDVYFIRSLKSLLDWQKEEMYLLYSYDDNGCINYVIAGTTPKARFYGAQTLRQLINQNTNGAIQGSCILDWPFTKIRGLRFNIGSGNREKWFEEVSGVDGKWGLQYTNLVTPTTTPTPYPNEPDAVSRLKYFANLKMNALMIQSCLLYHLIEGSQESGDYENNPLKTYEKFEHYWDYDWATPGWDYIGDKEYGFYPIITLFKKCKKLFIDPVPILCDNECVTLCMLEKPQEPDFNDKFFFRSNCHGSAFSEGVHCYRIPFIFQQGLNIAQPVYPVSVPIPIENAVKNGDFSENQFKDINATSTPVPYWDVNQTNTRLDCSTFLDGVVSCHLSNGSELIQVVNLPDRYKNTYMKLKLSGKIDNTADELKPSVSVIETGYIYPPSPRESSQKWYTSWRDYPYTPPVGIDQENRTDVFYTGTNNSLTIKASAGALTGNLFLDGFHLQLENLVRNPDFHESGLSPWITIGSGVSLQNESFYINRASFGISGVFQDIYCLPDMDYKFSCKVKHRLYHSTNVMMRICKLDGQCNEGDIIYCRSVGTDISDWRDLEINYSTPSSSLPDEDEFIVIRLWLLMDGRGEAWFDDVKAVSKDMEARTLELVENKDKFKPLLKNGNFEEDITPSINNDLQYWNESGDCYFDTEYSVFKRGCAELSAETQSLSKITQSINIDDTNLHKYTEYFVRGHMKVQPTDTNGDVESRIKTTLINDSIPIETKTGSHVTDKESNWFRSETEVLDTGNNDSLLVECEVEKKGGNGGDAKFDAIYVFKTNYIKNSAFSHVDQGNPQKAARWDAYNGTWGNDITFANDCVSMNFGSSALGIKQTISFSNASEKYREYMLTAKAYQKYPSVADIVLLDSSDQIVTCYYQDNPDSENSWYTIKKYYYLKGDTTIKVYAKCVGGDEGIDCSFDDIRLESRSYAENGGFEYPTPTATPIPTSSATPTPTPINYGKPDQWDLWDVSHSRNVDFSQSPYEMVIRFDVSKFPITDPNNSNSTFSRIHHVNKFKCLPWQTLRIGVDIKMERVSGQYNGHPHIMVIFKDENGNNLENCHYYYRNTWPYIGSKIDTGWHEQVMIINTGHSKEFEAYLWDYEIEAGNAYGYTYFNNFRIETGFKDNKDLKLVYDPYGYVSSDSFVLETQNGSTSYKMNDMGNEAWDFEILQNIKVDEHQTYKISRDQGKITQTDIIYLASWNQSIGNTDYCMASSECRNFREFHINTLKNVLQDNGVDLKYVHLNRDELRNTQLDGRSIELGKDLGEMLQYDLSFWDQTLGQDITPIMWGDKIIHRSPEDNTYQPRILCNMKHAIDGISKRFISFSWMYYPYYPLDTRFDPPGDDNMADSFMHQCINQDIDHFERMGFSTGGTSMKWNNALAWMEFQKDWPSCIGHIDAGWDASWYIKEISTDDPEYPKVDLYWKGDISLFYDAKEIYFQTYLKRYDLFNKYTHEKWNGVPTSMDASWHPGVYHYDETQQKYLIPYDPQKMNDSYGNITNSKN